MYEVKNCPHGTSPDINRYHMIPTPPLGKTPIVTSDVDTTGDGHIQFRQEESISFSDFEMKKDDDDSQSVHGVEDWEKEDKFL